LPDPADEDYGLSLDPFYDPTWQTWIDLGGIIAVAHLRGCGEYGDTGTVRARISRKSTPSSISTLSAQYLTTSPSPSQSSWRRTAPARGAIVMGAALTINAGLFCVVLDDVSMSDALRSETEPMVRLRCPNLVRPRPKKAFMAFSP
jgi:prolyl oligopeptidase